MSVLHHAHLRVDSLGAYGVIGLEVMIPLFLQLTTLSMPFPDMAQAGVAPWAGHYPQRPAIQRKE